MIWVIFLKEFKELIRDRKHLIVTILMPIILTPVMMYVVGALQVKAQMDEEAKVFSYVVIYQSPLSGFSESLQNNKLMSDAGNMEIDQAERAIRDETLDIFIQVKERDGQTIVEMAYKKAALVSTKTQRISEIIDTIKEEMVTDKLEQYGVANEDVNAFLHPVLLERNNLATKKETLGQTLGSILPFFILIWIISTAIAISSDLIAGEKERGTLETLIISPVPLLSMITGKWLAITLSAWLAGVLTLFSLWGSALILTFWMGSEIIDDLLSTLSIFGIIAGVVIMLPTAGLVSSIFLVSGSIAQSFKEAQSYASGIMMLLFFPLFATMSGSIELNISTALIPIMNTSLAFTEILVGSLEVGYVIPIVLVNSALIFAVLTLAVAMYKSEYVLLRQ